ncbi:ORFL151C.iORF1 [Human betaherpesvirus 5]|nr:ORFL151C.iORF1 [Human betaherpesvirus 5]QHX40483.1 ORFL151C.iORF1 [Human betaherpesvirus 5]
MSSDCTQNPVMITRWLPHSWARRFQVTLHQDATTPRIKTPGTVMYTRRRY